MTPPRKPEYSEILLFAFRYCVGRQTYVVNDMVSYLKHEWHLLDIFTKDLIKKEIKQKLSRGDCGMEMDVECWKEVLEL